MEILSKVGFDWRLALFNLISFLIIYWILKRYLFGPVKNKLDERRKLIEDGVHKARQAETDLKMATVKAQEIIDEAKVIANQVMARAHEDAEVATKRMKEKAKEEISFLIAQAKKNIDIDRQEMREAIRQETVELIIAVAEKVLNEKLDDKRDKRIIEDVVATLK